MACGLPLIATENTGAPDLVTEGREGYVRPDPRTLRHSRDRIPVLVRKSAIGVGDVSRGPGPASSRASGGLTTASAPPPLTSRGLEQHSAVGFRAD